MWEDCDDVLEWNIVVKWRVYLHDGMSTCKVILLVYIRVNLV